MSDPAFGRLWEADRAFAFKQTFGSLEIYKGGSLLRLRVPHANGSFGFPGKRSNISSFTSGSRRRLLHTVAKLQRAVLPIFLSLTYPGVFPVEYKVYKSHLRALFKRIVRVWPGASMVWKLEFQERGAPHFHCLLYGVDNVEFLSAMSPEDENEKNRRLRWIDYAWYSVVGSGDERHLYAGVNSTWVESSRGVMWYCAKYMSKYLADPGEVGRYWGMMGRPSAPWAAKVVLRLIGPEAWRIRRTVAKLIGRKVRGWRGLTAFCNPDRWVEFVLEGTFHD